MARVRFLQSVALISSPHTYGFNDELVIEDEKFVQSLVKQGLVDVLVEEKPEPKPAKKAQKRAKNEADLDA